MISISKKLGVVENDLSFIIENLNSLESLANKLPEDRNKADILAKIKTIKSTMQKSLSLMTE